MKKIYVFLFTFVITLGIIAQPCLPDGITFNTQSQIDNFQVNYPNCTEIQGHVFITGDDITNLNGLSVLTAMDSSFVIYDNTSLTHLTGLEGVTYIGNMIVENNDLLVDFSGLENLAAIGERLIIWSNPSLSSVAGFSNLTSIGGLLSIENNNNLTSLTGLDNIDAASIEDLYIQYNPLLSHCEVESICEYLSAPNGLAIIYENAEGCSNTWQILDSCEANSNIPEQLIGDKIFVYPNPSHSSFNIDLPTQPSYNTTLTLSNTNGQQLITQPITEPQTEIDISHLPNGIYIVKVWNEKDVMVQKIIKQ